MIPKRQIQFIVDRIHVSEPDSYVRAEIRRRALSLPGWTPALIRKAEDYAVRLHHDNQRLYRFVMGGGGRKKNRR